MMDNEEREALHNSNQPRHLDKRGDEELVPGGQAYDKYPPFTLERLVLALLLTAVVVVVTVITVL